MNRIIENNLLIDFIVNPAKRVYRHLPTAAFFRVNKFYIVNTKHISSLNNNDIQIGKHEIPIGNTYRNDFFERFVSGKLLN